MKKTLTALAVSAATLAFGANAATTANYSAEGNDGNVSGAALYNKDGNKIVMNGRVEAVAVVQDGKVADKSRARIGLGGIAQINDNLYGVGYWQGQFSTADTGTSVDTGNTNTVETRYAYAGIGGTFGQVTYGKQDGTLDNVTDMTDIMPYFGDSASTKLNVGDRPSNTVTYQGSYNNLTVKANYRFADYTNSDSGTNNKGTTATSSDNGQSGYSGSATYAIGDTGATVAAGYANQDNSNEWMTGAGYTIGNFYLGGLYTNGTFAYNTTGTGQFVGAKGSSANPYEFTGDQDYRGYEAAASYTMGKTVFTTTYNRAKTGDYTTTDLAAVDATYYFTSNFRSYVGYQFNLLKSSDQINGQDVGSANSEDQAVVGMRYDF